MGTLSEWSRVVQQQMDAAGFTLAEQQLAWILLRGSSNREIGNILGISPQTVKNHLSGMMKKTKTKNRLALGLALLDLDWEDVPAHLPPLVQWPRRRARS